MNPAPGRPVMPRRPALLAFIILAAFPLAGGIAVVANPHLDLLHLAVDACSRACFALLTPLDKGLTIFRSLAVYALIVLFVRSFLEAAGEIARTRQALSRLRKAAPGRRLLARMASIGLAPRRVVLFHAAAPAALTAGLAAPRIYLSTGLLASLDDRELAAVLLHEEGHRRRRDPLRAVVASALGRFLFFLPATPGLGRAVRREAEFRADDRALGFAAAADLASALLRLKTTGPPSAGAAAFAGGDFSLERLERLVGESRRPRRLVTRARLAASLFLYAGLILAVWSVIPRPPAPSCESGSGHGAIHMLHP